MAQTYCTVPTKKALYALKNHADGECVYCKEDEKIYIWKEEPGEWNLVEFENKGISMNLYDLNKSIVNQLEPMSINDIIQKLNLIDSLHAVYENQHYMLLSKDYNYYTIFEKLSLTENLPKLSSAVYEIISELGKVMSIELTETEDAIEIWIVPEGEESAFVFYLFPYDAGVVYYG